MVTSEPPSGVTLRFAQRELEATLADTPITVLQGARQVGKSTLAKTVTAGRAARFLSLDATAQFNAASADPDAFVRQTTDLLVIDEVQRVPALIRAMKDAVEDDRRPGRFLITGSANLLKIPGTEESLAGRAETVVLYGFSQGELSGNREDFVDRVMAGDIASLLGREGVLVRRDYLELACAGSYPEPITRSGRRRNAWFDNYIQRIVTRDAEELSNLAHLDRLPDLLRLLAANTSGELVKARIADAARIPASSITPYFDLLDALYLTQTLPAWGENLTQRVTRHPKVSLLDTGLIARLNNLTPDALAPGAVSGLAGGLLESFVAAELRRQLAWADTPAELFHFRDRNGAEVDIIIETQDRLVAGIEMKSSGSPDTSDFRHLKLLREKLGDRFRLGVVLYTGKAALPFGDRLVALPYSALWT
jgi:predicted AAA+ superfamily ATPase